MDFEGDLKCWKVKIWKKLYIFEAICRACEVTFTIFLTTIYEKFNAVTLLINNQLLLKSKPVSHWKQSHLR